MKIENEFLRVELNELGGCFKSIYDKKNNEELLYQPDGTSWSGQDVVIFPVIAALKNHSYMVDGKEYFLKNHGIIRYSKVSVKSITDTSVELYLEYNDETLKIYPYMFLFIVKYTLNNNTISVEYKVKNLDKQAIYFALGGHPALKASGTMNDNGFEFTDTYCTFNGQIKTQYLLNESGDQVIGQKEISLTGKQSISKKEIEKYKTLIYDASTLSEVNLHTNGHNYLFNVKKSPILAIWSMKQTGKFICIEPWWGLPDYENPELELKNKPLIKVLNMGQTYTTGYSITITGGDLKNL